MNPLLVLLVPFLLASAAPTVTTSSTHISTGPTVHTASRKLLSTFHHPQPSHTSTTKPLHPVATFTPPAPGQVHTRATPLPSRPSPSRTPLPTIQSHPPTGQKPISIVFEVIGGIFASAVLISFIRCYHNYRTTPARDRIADILHRHQLQRELEELERNPGILRRHASLREPAPPYFPRPPSYDTSPAPVSRGQSYPQPEERAQYSAVATHSPPPTPPMSERLLSPVPAASSPHTELT